MYLWHVKTVLPWVSKMRSFIEPLKLAIFPCEYCEETPWHLPRECPNPQIHNQLPPDHWEVNHLARLINKIKFIEVPQTMLTPTTN